MTDLSAAYLRRQAAMSLADGASLAATQAAAAGSVYTHPHGGYVAIDQRAAAAAVRAYLAHTGAYGEYPGLDQLVPARLARMLCANNCIVTRNISPLEPGNFERKYYAPGIGVFLETAPKSGEVNRLVKCNVDARCAQLPQ